MRSVGGGLPEFVNSFFAHTSAVASLSPTAIECVFVGISVGQRYIFYMALPLALVVLSGLIYIVGKLYMCRPGVRLSLWPPRCVYMALHFLQLCYFDVMVKVFGGLSCTLSDPSGLRYLNQYPWIPCSLDNSEYVMILALSCAGFVLYVLGVPAILLVAMLRRRKRRSAGSTTMLGFLYSCYRKDVYWWEVVFTAKRVMLSLAMAAIPFNMRAASVLTVVAILQISIILQHIAAPFQTALENRLLLTSYYVLFVGFLAGFISQTNIGNVSWLAMFALALLCTQGW